MADGKGSMLGRRSRPTQKVVAARNKGHTALPLSMIKAEEPMTMRTGDWISLAGLVVSVIGFSVTIRQLIRIAQASEADHAGPRAPPGLGSGPREPSSEPSAHDSTAVRLSRAATFPGHLGVQDRPMSSTPVVYA